MCAARRTPMNQLARRLQQLAGPKTNYARGKKAARVVAVASQKGGVGKTTTAVHLACALADELHQRVLLVDLDPQGHVAASLHARLGGRKGHLSQVIINRGEELLDLVQPVADSSLEVVLSDKKLAESEGLLASKIGKEFYLKQSLEVTRTHYDWIILDCPPHVGELTVNALVAADEVLVPTELSALSYEGVNDLFDAFARVSENLNPRLGILGIVLTKVDARTPAANASIRRQVETTFGPIVCAAEIPINSAIRQAQHLGQPLFAHQPQAAAALAYRALAEEITGRDSEGNWAI
ncbi:MAG: ParA family protein [Chrysiogenetes bacterium]|nr:ParA family protein [Chrysiogenetes bacterium]